MGAEELKYFEMSQTCYGLINTGRHDVHLYQPEWFSAPYDDAVRVLWEKGKVKEDAAKILSPSYISDADKAVHKWNGTGEIENFNWPQVLKSLYLDQEDARYFSKLSKNLQEGRDVDFLQVQARISSRVVGESSGLVNARDVDYLSYKPFTKSGNPVLDKILGGIPSDGPVIVYGVTGIGKSHWACSTIDYLLHEYPEKKAAIYTLEMSAEHYLWREINMYPSLKELREQGRLYVSGSVRNIEELVAEVTAQQVDYVVIDDMDSLVASSEASAYEKVYRRVREICRFLKIPVFVLCQPNREAKHAIERGERFLGRYDVAWSGAAENTAALQVALQRVSSSLDMESTTFPTEEDEELYYEIFWKSRDGWPSDYSPEGQQGPGAIVRYKSKQAWRGLPYSKVYRLWQPNSGSKKIGKKKKVED